MLALSALVAGGCGGGGDDGDSDREAISAVLEQLRSTQDAGDAETACSEVYVIQEAEGGEEPEGGEAEAEGGDAGEEGESPGECESVFSASAERLHSEVKDLSTQVGSIEVEGDRATAIVHTELQRNDGSLLSQDVPYDLVRTPDGWRVRIADEG